MKKKTKYHMISLVIFAIGAIWAIMAFGWQLLGIMFLLQWSHNIDTMHEDEEESIPREKPSITITKVVKKSKFQERLEEAAKRK